MKQVRQKHRLALAGGVALTFMCTALATAQEERSATLSALEQVTEGQISGTSGSLRAAEEADTRALRITADDPDATLTQIFALTDAWETRTTNPDQTLNYYNESQMTTTVTFSGPPPNRSGVVLEQVVNHLVLVWVCEREWVALFVVGDPIPFYVDPLAVPFLTAKMAGRFQYKKPISITVTQTIEEHHFEAEQDGLTVRRRLHKRFEHPEKPTDSVCLLGTGLLADARISSTATESFQGLLAPADTAISTAVEQSQAYQFGRIERISHMVLRLYPNP